MSNENFYDIADIARSPLSSNTELAQCWNGWELDEDTWVLTHPSIQNGLYEIDLDRTETLHQIGDWLIHVSEKGWPDAVVAGLVSALRDYHHVISKRRLEMP